MSIKVRGAKWGNKVTYNDPLGARTQDPNIKSVVLYLLS